MREPHSLVGVDGHAPGGKLLPWLKGEELARLRRMVEFFLLNNQLRKATTNHPGLRQECAPRTRRSAPLADSSQQYSVPVGIVGGAFFRTHRDAPLAAYGSTVEHGG